MSNRHTGLPSLDEIKTVGEGFLTQTWERAFNTNHNSLATGTNRYTAIALRQNVTYTNIAVECAAVGSGLTLLKFGLVKLDGSVVRAVTADVKASIATGLLVSAFAAAYTPTADEVVMAGLCCTFTTTTPTFDGTAALSSSSNAVATKALPFAQISAQTDFVTGTFAASSSPIWFALT